MSSSSNNRSHSASSASRRKSASTVPSTALAKVKAETAELSPRQQAAIVALASGQGFTKAAEAAGVSRQSIYDWRRKDPRFAALLHAWESDTKASAQHRLLSLVDAAVTNVDTALAEGDVRLSMELLRGMEILAPIASGETDPDLHARRVALARKKREADQSLEETIQDTAGFFGMMPPDLFAEEAAGRAKLGKSSGRSQVLGNP